MILKKYKKWIMNKSEIKFLKDQIIKLRDLIDKDKIPIQIEKINKDETISEISINKELKEKEKEKEINLLRSSQRMLDSKITGFSID